MKALVPLIIIVLMIPVLSNTGSAAGDGNTEEIIGDWVITEDTVIYNRSIVLQGDLKILGGGLTMVNSSIYFRCYADGEFFLLLEKGTYLRMYDSSFDREQGYKKFFIQTMPGSSFEMENSSISHAGYAEREYSGLFLQGQFSISNSSFLGSYTGIWAENVSGGSIYGSAFESMQRGVFLESCRRTIIEESRFEYMYNESIHMQDGADNSVLHSVINHTYGPEGRGIHAINESFLLVEENVINATSREGILLEGNSSVSNMIQENVLGRCGIAQISMKNTGGHTAIDNVLSGSYLGILLKSCKNTTLRRENIEGSSIGIRVEDSHGAFVAGCSFKDMKYGLMFYSSDAEMTDLFWENVTYRAYFSDSTVFSGVHLYSDEYYLKGESALYLYKEIRIEALHSDGTPMQNISINMSFEGRCLFTGRTGPGGAVMVKAPYVLHTKYGRNYSWCEALADERYHFEENPIRFYAWDTDVVSFRETSSGLLLVLDVSPVEVKPHQRVNLTLDVIGENGPVDGADIHLYLNGSEMFPPSPAGNGRYEGSFTAPNFEGSLRIEVTAEYNGTNGTAYTTIMRAEEEPDIAPEEPAAGYSWEYYLILLPVLIVLVLIFLKRRRGGGFESMKSVPKDELDIQER